MTSCVSLEVRNDLLCVEQICWHPGQCGKHMPGALSEWLAWHAQAHHACAQLKFTSTDYCVVGATTILVVDQQQQLCSTTPPKGG